MAVGTMAIATSKLTPLSNLKGKAVHIIHVYKDHLWAMGTKAEPPDLAEMPVQGELEEEDVADGTEALEAVDGVGKAEASSTGNADEEAETEVIDASRKLSADGA